MAHRSADWRTPTAVLFAGGLILTLAMGIRHGFGLVLQPISAAFFAAPAPHHATWTKQSQSGRTHASSGSASVAVKPHVPAQSSRTDQTPASHFRRSSSCPAIPTEAP